MQPDTAWTSWPIYGLGDVGYNPSNAGVSQVVWETGALNNAVGNGSAVFGFRRAAGVVFFNIFMLFGSSSVFG